jgi:hypothetical protein
MFTRDTTSVWYTQQTISRKEDTLQIQDQAKSLSLLIKNLYYFVLPSFCTLKCLSVHYSQSLSKKQPLLVQIFQHSTFTSTNTYNLSQPENNWKVMITMLWIFQIWQNNSNPISKHEKEETQPLRKEKPYFDICSWTHSSIRTKLTS